jgi:hypothetical protein
VGSNQAIDRLQSLVGGDAIQIVASSGGKKLVTNFAPTAAR